MKTPFKVNDVVQVFRKYVEKEEDYYSNARYAGVLVGITDDGVELKKPDGSVESFSYEHTDYSKNKITHSLGAYSEIQLREDIEKEQKSAIARVKSAEEDLAQISDWHYTFVHDISLLGKLKSFFKN